MPLPRLSTLQYNMLRLFASESSDYYMSYTAAQSLDQRPFRSMLVQRWVAYRAGRGFHLTREGRAAYRDFETHSIERKNHNAPLTKFFDAAYYGLIEPKSKPASKTTGGGQTKAVA